MFDTILLRAAAREGAVVHEGATVEELVWDGRAVAGAGVRWRNGPRATRNARVVVGADGLHSAAARPLGLVRTSPPRRIALTTHAPAAAGRGRGGARRGGVRA